MVSNFIIKSNECNKENVITSYYTEKPYIYSICSLFVGVCRLTIENQVMQICKLLCKMIYMFRIFK